MLTNVQNLDWQHWKNDDKTRTWSLFLKFLIVRKRATCSHWQAGQLCGQICQDRPAEVFVLSSVVEP
jgi:hypothetical protein